MVPQPLSVRRYAPRHAAPRVHPMRRPAALGVLALALAAGVGTAAQVVSPAQADAAQSDIVQVSAAKRAADQQRLLDLFNQYRASKGLKPLKFSQTLTSIEQNHSDQQVRDESFYHTTTFTTDSRAGGWTSTNEIIALSYQDDVKQLLDWWKTSPPHNAAILNPKAEVVGIALTYADGSLQNTGQPWRLLGTVNLYGYANGGAPADATSRIGAAAQPVVQAAAAAPTVSGGIGTAYRAAGGSAAVGAATTSESDATGGRYQLFSKDGRQTKILWSRATGGHLVKDYGAIGHYWSRAGFERGLGFPTTNEYRVGTEMRQDFAGGTTVVWNSTTGAVTTR